MIKALKKLPLPAKLFFASVFAIAGFIGGCEWKLNSDLERAISRAKNAGLATELADIDKVLPKWNKGKDSSVVVREATDYYKNSKARLPYDEINRYRPTAEDLKRIEPFRPLFDESSAILRKLKYLDPPEMKRDWSQGSEVKFNDNVAMNNLISYACYKAKLLAMDGESNRALELLADLMAAAQLFGHEPTDMSLFTRLFIESEVLRMLNEIIFEKNVSRDQFELIRRIGAQLQPIKPLHFYLQSAPIIARLDYRNGVISKYVDDGYQYPIIASAYKLYLKTDFSKVALAKLIEIETDGYLISKKYSHDPRLLVQKLSDYSNATYANLKPPLQYIIGLTMPYYGEEAKTYTKVRAIRELFEYMNTGLSKDDPFGKDKYLIKKIKNGRIIYSVGQFGTDEGAISFDAFRGCLRNSNSPALVIPDVKRK